MKTENPFEQIQVKSLQGNKEKSYQWYRTQINRLGLNQMAPKTAMRSELGELVTSMKMGDMYLFFYDPKTKETLPYYDIFPLVLPFKLVPRGFLGLNFHYLSPLLRLRLLNRLLLLASDETLSETTKIRTSWNIIGNASKYPEVSPCVKRYNFLNVRSKFLKINPQDWKTSVLLPLESFQGRTKNTVFKNSKEYMEYFNA